MSEEKGRYWRKTGINKGINRKQKLNCDVMFDNALKYLTNFSTTASMTTPSSYLESSLNIINNVTIYTIDNNNKNNNNNIIIINNTINTIINNNNAL